MQAVAEELSHGVLHEFIRDGLFGLVLVGGLRGEAVRHEDEAVGHVLERELRLALGIFARLLAVGIDGVDEGVFDGLFRRAAVLEPGGVVVILQTADAVGEAQGGGDADLVLRLVLAVAALALGLPELRHGERLLARDLVDIIQYPVGIAVVGLREFPVFLVAEGKGHARVDDGLALEDVLKVLLGDIDVGEDLEIGLPAEDGAGGLAVGRFLFHFADELALFKVEGVFIAVAADGGVEVFGRILRGAGAEAVEAEGEFVVAAGIVLIFAARVELAEDELPVVPPLFFVPVDGTAAAEVLDLDGMVGKAGDQDLFAVALARLVDGVGEDLKDGVLAALEAVGAEDDRRPQPDAVCALQRRDGLVSVGFLLFHADSSQYFVL